jgi:hypothetical protein
MKLLLTPVLSLLILTSFGQTKIDWNRDYQIQLSDFKSPTTQIGMTNVYSLYQATNFDFLFSMTRGEFIFTKNFNSKVNCSFRPDASSLVAPDSATANALIGFAKYQFDLSELYARKFRQQLFEKKGVFSSVDFLRPIYDSLQSELTNRLTIAGRVTDVGRNKAKIGELHAEVSKEIAELADYCKSCKPAKKKK